MKYSAKKGLRLISGIGFIAALFTVQSSAFVPYQTYTYLSDGSAALTPDAYIVDKVMTAASLGLESLDSPSDICVDLKNNVYIADTGNNRILCYDSNWTLLKEITGFEYEGKRESFSAPQGVYVTEENELYIADTGNSRVVALDQNGELLKIVGKPVTNLLSDSDYTYSPTKLTVDRFDRLFVVASGVNLGIIEFDKEGNFSCFVGSQEVSYNLVDYIWKQFMTEEQKDRVDQFVPTSYSNLVCDEQGFLYAVTSSIDEDDIVSAIESKSLSSKISPIKKFNHSGYDVLKRNGYFAPLGDLLYDTDEEGRIQVSAMVDVVLGEAGTYFMLDSQRNRIFSYTEEGELLYAFGGKGEQLGNTVTPVAMCLQGSSILVLDNNSATITIYNRTAYGDKIIDALTLQQAYQYGDAVAVWKELLKENSNFDLAYNGIGDVLLEEGNYKEAMTYFSYGNDWSEYSLAFKDYRAALAKSMLPEIFIVMIFLIVILVFVRRYIHYANTRGYKKGKYKLWYQLMYGFYIPIHPFDGFWCLKHEKRGSLTGSLCIIILTFCVTLAQKVMTAPLFNTSYGSSVDVLQLFLSVVGVIFVLAVSNWCLTTLMDGEGTFRDVMTVLGYAMLPLCLLKALTIPLSYLLTQEEVMYLTFFNGLAIVWTVAMVFAGILVVHQYTFTKNVVTCVLSVVGVAIILFIALLLLSTLVQIFEFIKVIYNELIRW